MDINKFKFTEAEIRKLPLNEKGTQALYWDTEIRGFGLRVNGGSKSYIVQARVKGREKRITVGRTSVFDLKSARAEAQSILSQMYRGIDVSAQNKEDIKNAVTLGKAFQSFEIEKKNKLKKGTLDNYRSFMKNHFADWKNTQLTSISTQMVIQRHGKITKTGPYAANHAMVFLGTLFDYTFAEDDNPPRNPVRVLGKDKKNLYNDFEQKVSPITQANLRKWVDAIANLNNNSMKAAFLTILLTGLRKQECLKLRWNDVDFMENVINIPHPKNRKPLTIPLSTQLISIFQAMHKSTNRHPKWVFPSTCYDGRITDLKSAVRIIRREHSFDFVTHDLRRTFLTLAYKLKISDFTIASLANHTPKLAVTARYINKDTEYVRSQVQIISDDISKRSNLEAVIKEI